MPVLDDGVAAACIEFVKDAGEPAALFIQLREHFQLRRPVIDTRETHAHES